MSTKKKRNRKKKEEGKAGGPKLSTAVAPLLEAAKAGRQAAGAPPLADKAVMDALPPPFRDAATRVFGVAAPTLIQAATWPPAAARRDIIVEAPPGSGKTLAYLVPMAVRLDEETSPSTTTTPSAPSALVLVPTRELARQVYADATPLRRSHRCACVYGGASRDAQVDRLAKGGVELLVATPGRLLDLVDAGVVCLGRNVEEGSGAPFLEAGDETDDFAFTVSDAP